MSNDITPSSCTFGTADLDGDTGDVFPSAVWSRLGSNTGFLNHDPHLLWSGYFYAEGTELVDDAVTYPWMAQGTYTMYVGYTCLDAGTLTLNGTTFFGSSSTSTATHTGFVVAADGFGTLEITNSGQSSTDNATWCIRYRREGR